MKSFQIISLLTTAVAIVSAAPSPFIPAGISEPCRTFLSAFNNDTSFQSCTAPIIAATSSLIGPNATAPTAASIKSTLDKLCAGTSACSPASFRPKLAEFATACQDELTSNMNPDVQASYEAFYMAAPLLKAVCSKSDDGGYCVNQVSSRIPASSLYTTVPDTNGAQTAFKPNMDTFGKNNILFLTIQPDAPKEKLCTSCTRSALTAFIDFQGGAPFAPGMANSLSMPGRTQLMNSVTSTCGANFLQGAVQAAGGLSGGIMGDNDTSDASRSVLGALTTVLGALAFVATAIF